MVVAVAASACLGFNYTRDRFNGVAVIFYAMAVYEATRAVLSRAGTLSQRWMATVGLGLFLLHGAWQLRAVGTVLYVRETASMNRKEWLVDLMARETTFADRPVYLDIMHRLTAQGIEPSTTRRRTNPRWVARVFGER